jgi:hypothetical protein
MAQKDVEPRTAFSMTALPTIASHHPPLRGMYPEPLADLCGGRLGSVPFRDA